MGYRDEKEETFKEIVSYVNNIKIRNMKQNKANLN